MRRLCKCWGNIYVSFENTFTSGVFKRHTVPLGNKEEIYFGEDETSETTNIPGRINLHSLHSQRAGTN